MILYTLSGSTPPVLDVLLLSKKDKFIDNITSSLSKTNFQFKKHGLGFFKNGNPELPPLNPFFKKKSLEEKIGKTPRKKNSKNVFSWKILELALEKEKHKVENEKQQTIASQREFQSLADLCKDFENKQQRLQSEIQNRDNRITSLEGLLSQAKKENCRLQQLENDLKELRGVREATLLEREQKNGNCDSGQNVKLQETNVNLLSDSLNENSEINISAEKGKNNYAPNENDLLFSLRKKISEQEKVIQELNLKLVSISDKECSKEILHTSANIPDRTQLDSLEVSPALRIKSVWNSFTFTPAKGNKEIVLGHHNDTITTGPVDEKVVEDQCDSH
ncbi:Centromere protein F like protein [Argiope bruennichi]|uniref:Centromere protein F like protein n=1 Tax=Argiope bruennichi TaxID=94029 RepID=A0A8T0E4V8_ARGBR|nr:Centromere protein F like protein [Argiope bruennichi]